MTEERAAKTRAWIKGITAALVAAVLVAVCAVIVIQTKQLEATRKNTNRLVDCTTPGGKCYEQGRNSTSGAVGTINKVTIATAYCFGKYGPRVTVTQLSTCVAQAIK